MTVEDSVDLPVIVTVLPACGVGVPEGCFRQNGDSKLLSGFPWSIVFNPEKTK
jgi:hypothetical protein